MTDTQIFDGYEAPVEVFEGRNWITSRLIMARGFHALDLIEDTCSFMETETAEQLRRRLREIYEQASKAELVVAEAFQQLQPKTMAEVGTQTAYEHIKICLSEIRDRGNLNGRESPVNLQLRLQWVLSLISHVKYHLAGIDE